ncbi:hypothetical protein PHYC_03250 [Phycisphaerales bacterium]|nr:hypothetical protein PHYC_03250 [Phycisphaerales bacterium]
MAEYSPKEKLFFGYAILNGDLDNSEWGHVDFDELPSVRVRGFEIDRDIYWETRPAGRVERIVEAHRQRGL